ncbi:DUF4913 domain-containing protein [Kribbella sp. NPDC003505]|uniref:DUF4913 domain-containing protein n=1 Tax=Kribbella sp. NPDC003505 TaxID=3154448 RepID=UPI0033BBF5D4
MSRLDALWRAWEYLRQDEGLGMSVWWREHADHHMTYLLDPDGPFRSCRNDQHAEVPNQPVPNAVPPAGVFEDEDGSAA